jgi:putative NADH-flavin reductase
VGLELTKAYLEKGWKVIAAVRDPSKMKVEGDVMVVKLEVGEKGDAKKVRTPLSLLRPAMDEEMYDWANE